MSVVPVLARTSAARRGRRQACSSVPLSPATGSAAKTTARKLGLFQIRTRIEAELARGHAVVAREPRAVRRSGRRRAARPPRAGRARTTSAPAAVVPWPSTPRADRLQHHLGGEVVAVVVHELEQSPTAAPSRSSRPASPALRRRPVAALRARIPRARRSRSNSRRRRERRVGDEAAVPRRAVDDERRERWRLEPGEPGEPAGRDRLRVEVGRVAQDVPRHPPDPQPPEDVGEPLEVARGERRVAEALEHEAPDPGVAHAPALAEHLGREAVGGPSSTARRRSPQSFSFEAGSSERSALRAKTTCPLGSSTTIAVERGSARFPASRSCRRGGGRGCPCRRPRGPRSSRRARRRSRDGRPITP